jgi:PAS domain S-box-containing protein
MNADRHHDDDHPTASDYQEAISGLTLRTRLNEIFLAFTDDRVYAEILSVVLDELDSKYGLIAYIDDDGDLVAPSLTKEIWDACEMEEKSNVFPRQGWGESLWGQCIIEKRCLFRNTGLNVPSGHIGMERAICCPILFRGESIGHITLANRETDYTESDRKKIEVIAGIIAPMLFARLEHNRESALLVKVEKQQRHLKRMLEAVGKGNQALIRATTEQELISEICRLFVEDAGYLLAWIGYLEHDEGKTITPVAWAGKEIEYIQNARLSWSDEDERGRGPAGIAVRSGKSVCVDDFKTDECMKVWRENALKKGYMSGAAFPLKDELGQAFAVLMVYSSKPKAVHPEELRFLEQLADDLAYGICALRMREKLASVNALASQNEKRLNEAQRLAKLGSWELDLLTNTLVWSDEVFRIFEVDKTEFGANYDEFLRLIHPEDREMVNKAYTTSIVNRQPYSIEHRLLFPDGSVKHVLESCETLYDDGGYPVLSIGTVQDITAQKDTARELVETKAIAECAETLKHAFIANISHEIRTPLNIILGFADLIESTCLTDAAIEARDYFNSLHKGSKRLMRTIDMILLFSRIQSGDVTLQRTHVDVAELIHDCVSNAAPNVSGKDLVVEFQNLALNSVIFADPACIAFVLENLMDNAVKFTAQGRVTVALSTRDEKSLALEINDTGVGISESFLQKIFLPYTQEEIGYSRSYDGIGLGLAISKGYLDLHGMDIQISSVKGQGTTVLVIMGNTVDGSSDSDPAGLESPRVTDMPGKKAGEDVGLPRILLVEDDGATQGYMRLLLGRQYALSIVDSSESALEILQQQLFDLVLMDISIKGELNGLDLTRIIRSQSTYRHLPIIAVTAHSQAVDEAQCLAAGCTDFVSKPAAPKALIQAIEHYLFGDAHR